MDNDPPPDSNESSVLKRIARFFGLDRTPDTAEDLEQEIQELIDDGEEQGLISAEEGQMINSILEFKDTLAREIMTPRTEMIYVSEDTPATELIELINEKGFSRIPVYSDTPDHVAGILYAKDLLKYVTCTTQPTAVEILHPAFFVRENHKIVDLLRDFKAKKIHIAIVTDEFGSVRGLVTLEDILEEIVGEIDDESDISKEGELRIIDRNTVIAAAKIDLEEIEKIFDLELPEGPYESIGGLILHQLGHLPKSGETIQVGDLTMHVIGTTKRRITKVKIIKLSAEYSTDDQPPQ